jgi:hypothetical protein
VRDSRGHALGGLKAADFEVLDNGISRQIVAFNELHTPGVSAPGARSTAGSAPPAPDASAPPRFVTFVSVSLAAGQPRDSVVPVSVRLTVDINGLPFTAWQGRQVQPVAFVVALLDPAGGSVTKEESIMDLALTDEKLASLRQTGLQAIATLNAQAGTFQVRAIVREARKGHLAAQTMPVRILPR